LGGHRLWFWNAKVLTNLEYELVVNLAMYWNGCASILLANYSLRFAGSLAEQFSHDREGVWSGRGASCSDQSFFETGAGHPTRIFAIEFDRSGEGYAERFNQFFASGFLAIHARNLFDLTDPPITVLFHDSRVLVLHNGDFTTKGALSV
jgi:hypothetical protein